MQVCFLDTSVLTNLIDVPGKNQQRAEVMADYEQRRAQNWQMVLPITSVIETGNHIAQLRDGDLRRACAKRFEAVLLQVIAGRAPFVLHEMGWDAPFLQALLDGATTTVDFVTHITTQTMGCGDLSILVERDRYRSRVARGSRVEVWTFDGNLRAYA